MDFSRGWACVAPRGVDMSDDLGRLLSLVTNFLPNV